MTGFGDARDERDDQSLSVEVRTINNRHFKLSLRTTEGYSALDSRVESVVREFVRRGTVNVSVRIHHPAAADDYRLNAKLLESYIDLLQKVSAKRNFDEKLRLEPLALLPGVIEQVSSESRDAEAVWPLVEPVLRSALEAMTAMRLAEGRALAADLQGQLSTVETCLDRIAARAPQVLEGYRQRLQDRVGDALAKLNVSIEPNDLVREVCIFSDRSDITEEVVRLRSHLSQFTQALQAAESAGRKLEFICQELGRETNTIGSKANDAEISHEVVEIKTALERIREQIQNVE